jgi:D-3-phosphoglycerate dehydrogenase
MKYTLSVLDVMAEDVRKVVNQYLGDAYDIRYASSYDRQEQLDLAAAADFLWAGWPKVDAEMIGQASKLKLIHKCGVGVDKVDLNAAREKGIKVYLTAGINAIPVSEMALMLMMAVMRHIVYANIQMRKKKWVQTELKGMNQHLTGKTVGIVGMGNIGKNLVKLLKGFECKILYYDVQRQPPEVETALGITYKPFEELLRESEVVSLHAPATPETSNMINAKTLALMGKNAILVNTARGELVDEPALVAALKNGSIAGAGLDVFAQEPMDPNSPLLSMDNVILSPHVAGTTLNNMSSRAIRIAKNLDAFVNGGEVAKTDIVIG